MHATTPDKKYTSTHFSVQPMWIQGHLGHQGPFGPWVRLGQGEVWANLGRACLRALGPRPLGVAHFGWPMGSLGLKYEGAMGPGTMGT